jgi:hypothetical protein
VRSIFIAAFGKDRPEHINSYEAVQNSGEVEGIELPKTWSTVEIGHWLVHVVGTIQNGEGVEINADIFEQGFDRYQFTYSRKRRSLMYASSLSAIKLRNHIIRAMRSADSPTVRDAACKVDNTFVYAHPSVASLTTGIVALLQPEGAATDEREEHVHAIKAMIRRFVADMPDIRVPELSPAPTECVVLITGTTGSLGSELLARLLADRSTVCVYTLNRPSTNSSPADRHIRTFKSRGLDTTLLTSSKLTYLEGDSSHDWLGLGHDTYEVLRDRVTVIIHNAWRLDFNLALASFTPNVRSTRNLVDLALTAVHARHIRFLFTSSIAVTASWPKDRGPVPEQPLASPMFAVGNGYGEGKYVAEQVRLLE